MTMMEVLPGHGRHVFVVGRHHLGCNVIHPGWVSYKKKCIKLKAVGYTHVLLECATAPGTVVDNGPICCISKLQCQF